MPLKGVAPTVSKVFDEMAGRYASSVMEIFFALVIARDLLSFTIAVVRTMQLPSS